MRITHRLCTWSVFCLKEGYPFSLVISYQCLWCFSLEFICDLIYVNAGSQMNANKNGWKEKKINKIKLIPGTLFHRNRKVNSYLCLLYFIFHFICDLLSVFIVFSLVFICDPMFVFIGILFSYSFATIDKWKYFVT